MNYLKNLFIGLTALFLLASCNQEDSTSSGNGNLTLQFENGFGGLGGIVLNSTTQTSSNNQKHQFSTLKYIISNVVLTKDDGTEVKYNYNNPDLGAFIVDQADAVGGIVNISLTDIPAANYTKIKIGLGISPDAYLLGQLGQAVFWTRAQAKGLTWTWAAGYIDIKTEGMYGTSTPNTIFQHHLGKMMNTTNPDVYREVSLNLPVSAKVRTTITPTIHFMVDFNKYLSGATLITLNATNEVNMSGTGVAQDLADNLTQSFSIAHVHND